MTARSVAGVLVAGAIAGLALAGCTSAERPAATIEPNSYAGPPIGSVAPAATPSAAPSAAAAAPSAVPSAVPAPATGAAAAGSAPAAGKVSATTASTADLVRVFTAAGVPTPARWADEVVRNRPYPANDPTLAKLRQNLAKGNPPPGALDKIVSVLTP